MSSAQFSLQDKLDALQAALNAGVITQQEYNTKVILVTNPVEPFSLSKFLSGLFSVFSPTNWAKDIASIFNIRKIIIYVLIGGAIYYFGIRTGTPHFNISSLEGQSYTIDLGGGQKLDITKSGILQVTDMKGKVLKTIKSADIPELNKILKPIGFVFKPFIAAGLGGSTAQGGSLEGGAGFQWFKLYYLGVDVLATNKAIYPLGISYNLSKFAGGNTSVGIAGGMGYKGDARVLLYVKVAF